MKKLSKFLCGLALLVLCSCGGATYIDLEKDEVNFSIEGGEESVNIIADGSWEIASCPDWVTIEKQEGVLIIKTNANETGDALEGNIVLTGKDGVESTISVIQATKCSHIIPAEDMVNFDEDGGTETIDIDTDGAIQVEAPAGFDASYADGVLTVTTDANDGGKRSGKITLSADDQRATISVSQKGNVCPRCNGSGIVKCSKCGGKGYYRSGAYDEWLGGQPTYGCSKCGGGGSIHGYSGLQSFHEGSGRMTCPECGGSGH